MRILALLVFAANLSAQIPLGGITVSAASVPPTFTDFVYNNNSSNSASVSSFTTNTGGSSGSLSISAGDLVVVMCRNGGSPLPSDYAVSDSLGNTYSSNGGINGTGANSPRVKMLASRITTGGTTAFTCTPSGTNAQYVSMIALHFSYPPASMTIYLSAGGTTTNVSGNSTVTTSAFTTSSRSFLVQCASASGTTSHWVTNTFAGNSGTLVATDAATLTTNTDAGCAIYTASTALTSKTASMDYNGNTSQIFTAVSVAGPMRPSTAMFV